MKLASFTTGPFAENTYLLSSSGKALIVDPGFAIESDYKQLINTLEKKELSLKAVLLTHAHVDHVLGLHLVLEDFDIPVFLSGRDRYLWNNFSSQASMFGLKANDFSFDPEAITEQKNWTFEGFCFDLLSTPGHAPDHLSFYDANEGIVVAGDALFRESIGRTDLYKGDLAVLKRSIKEKLYSLPDDTVVYPGHGPNTTIAYEKKNNPFVDGS